MAGADIPLLAWALTAGWPRSGYGQPDRVDDLEAPAAHVDGWRRQMFVLDHKRRHPVCPKLRCHTLPQEPPPTQICRYHPQNPGLVGLGVAEGVGGCSDATLVDQGEPEIGMCCRECIETRAPVGDRDIAVSGQAISYA